MANKITDEQGNTYVQKKPFYKKVWFWILIVLVLIIGGSAAGSDSDSPKKVADSSNKAESKSSKNDKTDFKVGDTIETDGVKMTVNSVEFPAGSEFNTPEDGKSWVVVNLTIKNDSNKVVNYNPFDFKLDADGNSTSFTGINMDVKNTLNSGDLKKGASVSGNLVGEADNTKKLSMEYRGNLFSDDAKFSVKLN